MRGLYRPLLLLTIAFAAGMTVLALLAARSAHNAPAADTARLNDAVQRLSAAWPHPETAGLGDMADQLRVVDLSGDPVPLTGGSGEDAGRVGEFSGCSIASSRVLRSRTLMLAWYRPLTPPLS